MLPWPRMESAKLTAGVIGLGIMGGTFARHLAAAGIRTLGYDPLPEQMEAAGVDARPSARAVAEEADVLITSLPHVAALVEAVDGIASAARPGLLLIETSTLPLDVKETARARLAARGAAMLDAPVSGTGSQARVKDITVFASGDRADFDRVRDMLGHFARSVRYIGPFGTSTKLKFIANLLVAVHIVAAGEALALGEKAGFDPAELADLLVGSAATSRMLEVRGPIMAASDYNTPLMKVDVFQKDLALIADFAARSGAAVPLFTASVPVYAEAAARGMGGCDIASVIAVLRQIATHL